MLDCQTSQELIPAFLLDALEPGEQVALLDHLSTCASCRAEADSLRPVVSSLGLVAADAGQPAPAVKQRLMANIGATAKSQLMLQPQRRFTFTWRWTAVFTSAALGLALIIGLGAALFSTQSQLMQQQTRLDRLTQIQVALQNFMLNENIQTVPVTLTSQATSATAMLYMSGDKVAMAVTGLPPLAGDSVYQCWWTDAETGETMAGKSFKVDANGAGVWVWQIPEGGEYSRMTITQESQPGNTQIEGPVVLTANL